MFTNNKGFSLVEVSIAMGVAAVLLSALTPLVIRSLQMKAAQKTATEISIIQEAARGYFKINNVWPESVNNLQDAGFIDPKWVIKNPWSNDYIIGINKNLFYVSTQIPSQWTGMVARNLPASSVNGEIVTSSISSLAGVGEIETGIIVAWSGAIVNIPQGWVLCDGKNGTPDLRDKFIIGSSEDENDESKTTVLGSLDKVGGSISHDHGGKTGDHVLTINEMPRHHHGYMATPWTGGRYDGHSSPLMTEQRSGQTDDEGGNQPHNHTIGLVNHLPPFYALAFIMKIS